MAEEAGGVAVDGESVEQTGAGEEGVVGGGDDAGHEHGVDEAAGDGAAGLHEDDGKRAGGGVALGEARVVVGHVEADNDDRHDVEEDDAPEDVADHFGEVFGRVFGFAGCYGNGLGAAAGGVLEVACACMDAWIGTYYANEAVTKTEANPPMPPTNGASPT